MVISTPRQSQSDDNIVHQLLHNVGVAVVAGSMIALASTTTVVHVVEGFTISVGPTTSRSNRMLPQLHESVVISSASRSNTNSPFTSYGTSLWNEDDYVGRVSGSSSNEQSPDHLFGETYFQLEELEDCESATTELYLHSDNTVSVGETDGPMYLQASGTWTTTTPMSNGYTPYNSNGSNSGSTVQNFAMTITRRYEAGREKSESTDVGTFEFDVERTFLGEIIRIGANVGVSGKIHMYDDLLGDEVVGYFNMIDTTKEQSLQQQQEDLHYESNKYSTTNLDDGNNAQVDTAVPYGGSWGSSTMDNYNSNGSSSSFYAGAPNSAGDPATINAGNNDNYSYSNYVQELQRQNQPEQPPQQQQQQQEQEVVQRRRPNYGIGGTASYLDSL